MSLKRWLYTVPLRLRSIFHHREVECELEEELQYHLDMKIAENMAKGMAGVEARRAALIAMGGIDQKKEECRDTRGLSRLTDIHRNFRYAVRSLSKAPLLSLVVLLSLGLGIGANTAIFSIMHQVLMCTLSVEHPEELALVTTIGAPRSGRVSTDQSGPADYIFSYPAFRELERQQQQNLSELAGFRLAGANIAYGSEAVSGSILMVSGGYFPLLRVRPPIGRILTPLDDQGGGNRVAVLGYDFWRNKLGGETGVLNQPMRIAGQVFTVVGVAPKGFLGTTQFVRPDVFIPLAANTVLSREYLGENRPDNFWIYLLARIRPGFSREKAAARYAGAYAAIVEAQIQAGTFMGPQGAEQLRKSRLQFIDGSYGYSWIRMGSQTPFYILLTATGMVLLIGVTNAASLLLARSASRRREIAIRAAIGSNRSGIARLLLWEAMALSVTGGIAGMGICSLTLRALIFLAGQASAASTDFLTAKLEWPILLYGLALSLFSGLLFGSYPALEASRIPPLGVLNQESGQASPARGSARIRKGLVCAQVMISAVLLIPTGLFLKSLVNLTHVDLGLSTENLITFRLSPGANGYTPEQTRALFEREQQQLAAIPGISGVSSARVSLISGGRSSNTLTIEGFTGTGDTTCLVNEISPGFFGRIGIPLITGREFTERDNLVGQKVAIINEQFARTFFPGQNPLGRKIVPGWGPKVVPNIEIIGVVKDSHYASVRQKPENVYYTPWLQDKGIGSLAFYVRTPLPSKQVFAQLRRVTREVDATLPVDGLRTMEDQVRSDLFQDRLVLQLAGSFAVLATALAMMGLYGVMAHSVIRRTKEIGIRIAVGAKTSGIQLMIFREMMVMLSIGLALGIPGALALSKVSESALFGVKSHDPVVVAAGVLALGLAAFAAAYLPAWRASRVDPLNALRCE